MYLIYITGCVIILRKTLDICFSLQEYKIVRSNIHIYLFELTNQYLLLIFWQLLIIIAMQIFRFRTCISIRKGIRLTLSLINLYSILLTDRPPFFARKAYP